MLKMMSENNIGTEATRVNAINSMVKDGGAVATALTDERGIALRTPVVLTSTQWAQGLVDKLPPSLLGSEMTSQVREAVDAVRAANVNTDPFFVGATKWILRVMPQEDEHIAA